MAVDLTCKNCNTTSTFQDSEISGGKAECPKCGTTIRIEGDALSETMRIDPIK